MMDDKDKKLANLLQEDAKKTTKQLAAALDLSVTAVFERIKKLERQGIIARYVALVNKAAVEKNFTVLCHVRLQQHHKEYISQFEAEILKIPEIQECHHVSGDYDYILKINVKDISEYREFMVAKLTALRQIASTHSSFSIKEIKNSTAVLLD